MTNCKKLSIIIPAYNEGATIHLILDKIKSVELRNNIEKAKGKKIIIPIHFFGKEKKSTVNGFAGSGKANASKATFQKLH